MSRYFSNRLAALTPYTPGEQPNNMQYVKLNTNESPFPPSPAAAEYTANRTRSLNLYPDPECRELTKAVADMCGVESKNVLLTNGSDEILNFAFMAFCDENHPAAFADVTYGFYSVFAQLNRIPYVELPLDEQFRVRTEDYCGNDKTLFIANPNAPTGIAMTRAEIEQILQANPDQVVVIDEAYVDFGGESCIPLVHQYSNLLVTQTFSKSRSMAGARLGFGVACEALIRDLNTIKYSTNPYNINSLTMAAALGTLSDEAYTAANCSTIQSNREYTSQSLKEMGFEVLPSQTNFLFARHPNIPGGELYERLKGNGVLVRHFTTERIREYNRITIGTREQMEILLAAIRKLYGGLL